MLWTRGGPKAKGCHVRKKDRIALTPRNIGRSNLGRGVLPCNDFDDFWDL